MTPAVTKFSEIIKEDTARFFEEVDYAPYYEAARLIHSAQNGGGRLHVTGIGKPAHIAGYAASLFSSTGTPAYFLHGTEAVHGSCGQLVGGDVVTAISNSGETAELKSTAIAIRKNGGKLIAITGNADSWLAKFSDVHLLAKISAEGGPLNRAPRMSIIAQTLALQILSVILQEDCAITPEQYVLRHPGGSLGKLRDDEK